MILILFISPIRWGIHKTRQYGDKMCGILIFWTIEIVVYLFWVKSGFE